MTLTPAGVGAGGALEFTGGDYIYALRGSTTTNFYRYSISGNAGGSLASPPAPVAADGSLTFQPGGDIFAFRGNNSTTVWHYRIAEDIWIPAAVAPATVGAGGAMTYTGSNFIYALRGNSQPTFWRLEINPPRFDLSSQAGGFSIDARVEIDGTDVTVLIWDIN